jgi:glucose/arabinose dehydrogenase
MPAARVRRRAVPAFVTAIVIATASSIAPPSSARIGRVEERTPFGDVTGRGTTAAVKAVPVKTGMASPTGFTFGPKGKIWYLERFTGRVRVLNRATEGERTFFTITKVDGAGERGALGIALHPRFPAKPFVYAYVTRTDDGRLWNELIRIRADQGKGVGFTVLLRSPVGSPTNHNGGRILFGPDGKLFVFDGDNADPSNSQDRSHNLMGKVLRVNPDGSFPRDNPFGNAIWSFGHRNSFGMAFDPVTTRLWETENGPECNDEINLVVRAGNFAWGPHAACGSLRKPKDTNRDGPDPRRLPKEWFAQPIAITGAAFCDRCGLGGILHGDLIYGDVNLSRISAIDLKPDRRGFGSGPRVLLTAPVPVQSMEVGPRGRIYFSGSSGIYRLARA